MVRTLPPRDSRQSRKTRTHPPRPSSQGKFHKFPLFPTLHLPGRFGWFLMEIISPLVFSAQTLPMLLDPSTSLGWTTPKTILTTLWLTHYLNRTVIYTLRAPSISPMHIFTFLAGILFNLANAYTNGASLARFGSYPNSMLCSLRFWLGVTMWATGMAMNVHHDNILFRLRREQAVKAEKDGAHPNSNKTRYMIPRGSLFELVSCPSYLSETVEWLGYAVAAWSVPAWVFAAATPGNLFPRAWRAHGWYRQTFKDYPKERKALIPYVW
ncbi:3-oxo-5-alpha-steroid 4-dehydrogenase-domain-containing protein [Jimgerdemannia flammicorona]|uniref:3-oxo-5-alpha-steroid 4-dehydrogenase-domain-containing protein n=1 Tax=Jimgerdemannia flammicorona TaxID=994334 RepID=A0A433QBL2_9FUNG|nr:3-oxo-5-alpha-steroid 4-dehydrogenase-domain-containing protein [Jimgerdemannia flammicorona]